MILENFTTARCRECGWIKQFEPGKDYNFQEFKCKCTDIKEEGERNANRRTAAKANTKS